MSKNRKLTVRKSEGLMPEFRFPEFIEPWEMTPLSIVCDVYRGGAFSKADIDENGTELCIHYGELFTKYNEVIKTIYSKTNKSDGIKSKIGDILMPSSDVTPNGLVKASAILLDNVVLGGDMNILRPKIIINSIFLSYLLNYSRSEIIKLVSGTTVKHIYPSQIVTCQLPIISNALEQQKIASCLSSLDEIIAAHSQKLELLKDHKKSLLQNLFPKRGEKVPRYRFDEFVKDGDWVERKLEELAKRGSGHTPNKKASNYYNGGIKWVSLADSNKLDNRYIYDTKIQISKEGIENSSAVLHPAGTVILSRDAGVGKSAVLYSEMAVSQHFIVWVCEESKLSNWFLYYVFQILKPVFESIAVGSTIKTIGLPYFKELLIVVPSINEQLKIASCLFSMDELIAAQAEKIEQLKLHKKGLMQGLFPKMID
ncbi:MAG: restriction endonuclease subunit S [Chitinophaga sp.]|uniref:restriction endonuclease subunit S n=1 Tax=Chitinophaga sp. TaxID=1869181 RepID=UPI001B2AF4A5|nr:restriction endonuclease subunit S [Chitinophaga sp.]MBO9728951.1 restriction endonuclease subunit S [Chitinophaga sp.]